jgi:hypothetical protein
VVWGGTPWSTGLWTAGASLLIALGIVRLLRYGASGERATRT